MANTESTHAFHNRRTDKHYGCRSIPIAAAVFLCVVVFIGVMLYGIPFRLSGSYLQALEAAQIAPDVREALGVPIEASLGFVTGEISCGTSTCSADYSIPIHGPRKGGMLIVMSDSTGASLFNEGTWTLNAEVLVDNYPSIELTPPPTPMPTLSAGQAEATSGAVMQSTRRAQATLDLQATAASRDATATAVEATTQVQQTGTATAEAGATAQAIIATQALWPAVLTESFANNQHKWPVGLFHDEFLTVTAVITDGKYLWTVNPQEGNSYWNLIPANGKVLTSFYAAVDVQFIGDSQYAYGLVFRHVDNDYGFFGIQQDGSYRVLIVHHTGIYQLIAMDSSLIRSQLGQTNRIAVRAIGSDFIMLINDEMVWQLNEDMAPGDIGLGVDVMVAQDEEQVRFSNFEVHASP